ncbi:MAG: sulfatase-like hydrolase/transferase, partial [Candidatus Limnocylindria bacterium]
PLAAAIGGAAVLLLIGWAFFGDVHRAGIAASVLVAAFFSFGHAWNIAGEFLGQQSILLAVWGLLIAAGLLAAWRVRSRARTMTAYLNLLVAIPLAFTLVDLGEFMVTRGLPGVVLESVDGLLDGEDGQRPDIYYLVFDRYAGSPALDRHFGFDNEPFLQELEARGFYVARDSVANYPKTALSLTSTLDMEYLDGDALNAEAVAPADQGPINRRLGNRLLVPFSLKEVGYEFVLIPSWWPPAATNVDADFTLAYDGTPEFSLALLETTMVGAMTGPPGEVDPLSASELPKYTLHQLDRLREAHQLAGPQFIFAHFIIPHPPYLFDRDGSSVTPAEAATRSDEDEYLRQLEFTNAQILMLVDEIQAGASSNGAAIIIQADEGPFPERYAANGDTFRWEEASAAELEIKYRILNAFYLPGVDAEAVGLSPSITPVNSFRVAFNALFDADLPLLPDHVYAHTDYQHFYDFIEVTDRIPSWPMPQP